MPVIRRFWLEHVASSNDHSGAPIESASLIEGHDILVAYEIGGVDQTQGFQHSADQFFTNAEILIVGQHFERRYVAKQDPIRQSGDVANATS
jgi:hypothetical protein